MAQLELFAQPSAPVSTIPTLETVRTRIESVMAPLRASPVPPWSEKETARWRVVIPQMADWLPKEEADAVRAEFAALMAR